MKGPPRAVIFDMDGLMLDTEPLAARAWSEAALACGMAFDPAVAYKLVGRTFVDCRKLIADHHGEGYAVDTLMASWQHAYDAIVAREGVALKPGLVEILDWLEAQRVDKAVATSTRRERAREKLHHAKLLARFAALVGGDDVTRGKPDPEIFLTAAQRLAVQPADCLVLEDSPAGFEAAIRAGMHAIVVPDLCPPPDPVLGVKPRVMASLHDVRLHLAALGR